MKNKDQQGKAADPDTTKSLQQGTQKAPKPKTAIKI
jgi:hypothetical protein